MTDDLEADDAPDDTGESGSAAEFYAWAAPSGKGGCYIFPKGVEAWADEGDVALVHIDSQTGLVTVQHEIGQPFRDITKADRTGSVAAIKRER